MFQLKRTTPDDADFRFLIELLDADLWNRYPETQSYFTTFNIIKFGAKVIVAYHEGVPAGCGCFRETEDANKVEMKRMYVRENARGQGIAKAVLRELEAWAKEAGIEKAVLETGPNQPESISLYKKLGYSMIEKYGPYVDREDSICMGKVL